MAKKRILVAEPGKIGKLPPPEGRGSSKNDGRWGGLTDNMSSQYIRLHLVAWGPGGGPTAQFTETLNLSIYLFHFYHPYSVNLGGGGSKGSRDTLKF